MTLKKIWLNLKWTFGFRAVQMKEPSIEQTMVYVRIGRMVGEHKCPVCHCKYWVIGNPSVKGHYSPVCGKRRCYVAYYSGEFNIPSVTKKLSIPHKKVVSANVVRISRKTPKRSL